MKGVHMINLKERVKQFSVNLPVMEGRDKGELKGLVGQPVTIIDYGMMNDDGKEYVCFIVKEDEKRFYFGGQVLTDQLQQLSEEGYYDAIIQEGLSVTFGEKKSKNGRFYTTVEYN